MNTISCNTITGAVTEYDPYPFQSITPTHAGSVTGLYSLGGDSDDGLPIVSDIRLPVTLRETTLKKSLSAVYLSIRGQGDASLTVYGPGAVEWSYSFTLRPSGQTRCVVGRGIRENYVGFGLSNPDGQSFALDRVEVPLNQSKNRRL